MMRYLSLSLCLLLLCCCTGNRRILDTLDSIEPLILTDPAAAQLRLDSLQQAEPEALSQGEPQARYILLDTYCKYRQMQEGTNDSLISIAERYFVKHGSQHDRLLCMFLHGMILNIAGNYDEALLKFKEAEAACAQSGEHFLLGQLYCQMSLLCNHINDADFPLYAQKSLEEYQKSGDSGYILDGKINYAIALLDEHDNEASLALFKECLPFAIQQNDTFCLAKNYTFLGEAEIESGHFDSALVHLRQALPYQVPNFLGQAYSLLSVCYGYFQNRDSALYYHKLTKEVFPDFKTNYTRLKDAAYMYKYLGDYETALEHHIQYHYRLDIKYAKRLNHSFSKGQRDFAEKRIGFFEQQVQMLTLVAIFLCFVLSAGILFFVFYRNQQRRVLTLQDENRKNIIRGMKQSAIVARLKQLAFDETIPSDADWNDLNQLFEEMLPSFERKLSSKNKLNDLEWHICQLQKLDFSNKEISSLTCKAKNSISTINVRLFKRHFGNDGHSSDWLDFINSL